MAVPLANEKVTLETPEAVDAFLRSHPDAVIFKAGLCHKSPHTFEYVQGALGPHPELPIGIIRVVEARSASNHVERLTGIRHESPQFILFKDGKAVFDRDNWDITREDLDGALREHFALAGLPARGPV
ncbi:MAG TPA: monothiol bacilliredoxin BrxC family protein [Vicinamibacteria bacterium]|nr:monothiol bacilliredoxin BrxC family protein [Vicinamibacteria bacterium]